MSEFSPEFGYHLPLLLAGVIGCSIATNIVPVIEFKFESSSLTVNDNSSQPDRQHDLRETDGIAFCFRLWLRYSRSHYLIETEQLRLYVNSNQGIGFIEFKQLNGSLTDFLKHSRMIVFCQPFLPGEWEAMCFNIRLTLDSQEIAVVQNGLQCFKQVYQDTNLGGFNLKQNLAVSDL